MKTIIINYKELKNSIKQLEEDYPSRMHGDIDLLRANIKYNLFESLSGDILTVEIDDEKKEALIGGKQIEGEVCAICDYDKDPTSSEMIYEQILKAQEQAKQLGLYERIFKESEK